jgi:hypothetical protein
MSAALRIAVSLAAALAYSKAWMTWFSESVSVLCLGIVSSL